MTGEMGVSGTSGYFPLVQFCAIHGCSSTCCGVKRFCASITISLRMRSFGPSLTLSHDLSLKLNYWRSTKMSRLLIRLLSFVLIASCLAC